MLTNGSVMETKHMSNLEITKVSMLFNLGHIFVSSKVFEPSTCYASFCASSAYQLKTVNEYQHLLPLRQRAHQLMHQTLAEATLSEMVRLGETVLMLMSPVISLAFATAITVSLASLAQSQVFLSATATCRKVSR